MKYVIIGSGPAAISAAKTIRGEDSEGSIVMISKDLDIHSRCMLHLKLSEERSTDMLRFISLDFEKEYNIESMSGCEVTAVDFSKKCITAGGKEVSYDKLLIATGSAYVIPPIKNLREARNVFGFRNLSDVELLLDSIANGTKKIAVVGGGLVGLDVTVGLLRKEIDVTVIEMSNRIMPLQADEIAAARYQKEFEAHGAKFKLNVKVTEALMDENGCICGLKLDDGSIVDCDACVVAAGVCAEIKFLEGSGLELVCGVAVDNHMQTSIPDVYAAGDVTALSAVWPNAVNMGRVAANNMVGKAFTYVDKYTFKNTANFYGIDTLSLGLTDVKEGDEVITYTDKINNIYKRAVIRDGVITGLIIQGDISYTGFWLQIVKDKLELKGKANIYDTSFADYYSIDNLGAFWWAR